MGNLVSFYTRSIEPTIIQYSTSNTFMMKFTRIAIYLLGVISSINVAINLLYTLKYHELTLDFLYNSFLVYITFTLVTAFQYYQKKELDKETVVFVNSLTEKYVESVKVEEVVDETISSVIDTVNTSIDTTIESVIDTANEITEEPQTKTVTESGV